MKWACLLLAVASMGCISREQVEMSLFLNNGMDADLCAEPASPVWNHGFYRKLNDGTLEFISFCDPRAKDWVAIHKDDLKKLLDKLIKKKN